MESFIREITSELADNWPAFLYIATTTGFSVCFLRERRSETRHLRRLGKDLQETISTRFDSLEHLIQDSGKASLVPEVRTGSGKSLLTAEFKRRSQIHKSADER